MGDWSDCWCAFSCSICNQTATSLAVSRAADTKVMTTHTDHGKTSAERNSGRKLELSERNRRVLKRIVSKHHRTAAVNVTAGLCATHLEDPVDENLTHPTSTVQWCYFVGIQDDFVNSAYCVPGSSTNVPPVTHSPCAPVQPNNTTHNVLYYLPQCSSSSQPAHTNTIPVTSEIQCLALRCA